MAKKKNRPSQPKESQLLLMGIQPTKTPIIDTHTHLLPTFSLYRSKYATSNRFETVFDFAKGVYEGRNVEAIVDVYCEAPVQAAWRELANSALTPELRERNWNGAEYWFVMGVHPHEAKNYDDAVETQILEAMEHPRNVGWGEIGLDYHYDLSPRDVQQRVFTRQLQLAIQLGKPLTIHTREAEEDTERIMKEVVPRDHRIHVHCFTDSPEFAQRLLDHFPNLYIGITGVITYTTNKNTSKAIRNMCTHYFSSPSPTSTNQAQSAAAVISPPAPTSPRLRILLETDAPYMVPVNIYESMPELRNGARFPLCHTSMLPWTAEFVAGVMEESGIEGYDTERVMSEARENAKRMYGL